MSALGHVWTAPWQELSDVSAALVGCGHVSGLLMRRIWPLTLMLCADRVPSKTTHFRVRRPKRALPIPGTTVSALRRHALANFGCGLLPANDYAAVGSNLG
jgi:hypothetical protein